MVSEGTKWMLYDVKNILNKYFKYIRFKGFVLVTRENSILLDEKYGNKIYRKSVLPFASLTKQFTAAAVNELISTTSVTLETSIYDIYCKKCQIGDVSIRNLLTMQSGIVDYLNDSLYKEKLIKIINGINSGDPRRSINQIYCIIAHDVLFEKCFFLKTVRRSHAGSFLFPWHICGLNNLTSIFYFTKIPASQITYDPVQRIQEDRCLFQVLFL